MAAARRSSSGTAAFRRRAERYGSCAEVPFSGEWTFIINTAADDPMQLPVRSLIAAGTEQLLVGLDVRHDSSHGDLVMVLICEYNSSMGMIRRLHFHASRAAATRKWDGRNRITNRRDAAGSGLLQVADGRKGLAGGSGAPARGRCLRQDVRAKGPGQRSGTAQATQHRAAAFASSNSSRCSDHPMMFVSARVASQMRRLARTWTHELE